MLRRLISIVKTNMHDVKDGQILNLAPLSVEYVGCIGCVGCGLMTSPDWLESGVASCV